MKAERSHKNTHKMKSYTFTMTRTYETLIEVDANDYEEAIRKLSETDVYAIELEQCCVTDEVVINEDGHTIKDINFIN
jgi:hypothetical protein